MSIRLEIESDIGIVTIDRPDVHNALDAETIDELAEVWSRVQTDGSINVVVLTGAGDRAFSAGADLKELVPRIVSGNMPQVTDPDGPVFLKFVMDKPLIAAVKGYCIAGGTELLLATDIRVVSEDAVFGLAEAKWGLFPVGGSTVRLPRQIPYCIAMEILLTGETIDAQTALRVGLVNAVVPTDEVLPRAMAYAHRIARNSPKSVRQIKRSVMYTSGEPLERAYAIEAEHSRSVFGSRDAVEGPMAFLEKRAPKFGDAELTEAREED